MPNEESDRGVKLDTVAQLVPWAIVGVIVLIGAMTLLSNGLPWQLKTDAARAETEIQQTAALLAETDKQVNTLATNQAVMQATMKNIADQASEIADLRKLVEDQAVHIEGLEADEKANDSERAARMGERRR